MNQYRHGGGRPQSQYERSYSFLNDVEKVGRLSELAADMLIQGAEHIARDLAIDVRASQLRHVLDELNRIRMRVRSAESDFETEVLPRIKMLKPRLAYLAGRDSSRGNKMKRFFGVISAMVDRIYDPKDFHSLSEFVQAVVAYHRYHGGRDQ